MTLSGIGLGCQSMLHVHILCMSAHVANVMCFSCECHNLVVATVEWLPPRSIAYVKSVLLMRWSINTTFS